MKYKYASNDLNPSKNHSANKIWNNSIYYHIAYLWVQNEITNMQIYLCKNAHTLQHEQKEGGKKRKEKGK